MKKMFVLIPTFVGLSFVCAQQKQNFIVPNENLVTENIATIPSELAGQVKKYSEARGAILSEINPVKNEVIISTRFGSTSQLHVVSQPMGARRQITFF